MAGGGVPICPNVKGQATGAMVSDGAGGAIVAWSDFVSGLSNGIFAQRIGAAGALQWGSDGVRLRTSDFLYGPIIASDGAGGAIVVWEDLRDGKHYGLYAQRVGAAGGARGRAAVFPSARVPRSNSKRPWSRTMLAGPSSPGWTRPTSTAATVTSMSSASAWVAWRSGVPMARASARRSVIRNPQHRYGRRRRGHRGLGRPARRSRRLCATRQRGGDAPVGHRRRSARRGRGVPSIGRRSPRTGPVGPSQRGWTGVAMRATSTRRV